MLHQLPHELYIHVLEYAAERMNPIVISKLPSIITKYKMYKHSENYYKIDGSNSLPYYLYDHLYDDEHVFKVLKQCKCCKNCRRTKYVVNFNVILVIKLYPFFLYISISLPPD